MRLQRAVGAGWIRDGRDCARAPSVLGLPMHILNPAVGFYLMHAWIRQPNPAGMFTDWNPDVTCP